MDKKTAPETRRVVVLPIIWTAIGIADVCCSDCSDKSCEVKEDSMEEEEEEDAASSEEVDESWMDKDDFVVVEICGRSRKGDLAVKQETREVYWAIKDRTERTRSACNLMVTRGQQEQCR